MRRAILGISNSRVTGANVPESRSGGPDNTLSRWGFGWEPVLLAVL